MRPFALAVSLAALASGCVVHDTVVPPAACVPPTFGNSTSPYPQFNVSPGASTSIPGGDIGYLVTANGQGGYRLVWTDTQGSAACFTGIVTVAGDVSGVQGFSGQETLQTSATQIRFASVPGSTVDGVDFVSSTEPVYLDLYIDGSAAVNVYYTDSTSGTIVTTGANPVAVTSP